MEYVKLFGEICKDDVEIAGGKGASLGEMTRAGIPVPGGFVVLRDAFDRFIEETDLMPEIDAALDSVNLDEVHSVNDASEKIQAMILGREMPEDISEEILKDFEVLSCDKVAVRSSATSEDSADAAWAGQLDSFLNTTRDNVLENVKKCWASLFTPRAIFYRFEKKLHEEKVSVAVVVQKMIESEESGIAFSVHPVTEDYNQIIIEAGFGLGEAIVSGAITPDSYVVDKRDWKILDVNVSEQSRGLFGKAGGGNEWRVLGNEGKTRVLSDKEIVELSKLIVKIEDHYGFPCDIEWAKVGGEFFITQSRPITTLRKRGEDESLIIISKLKKYSLEKFEEFPLSPVVTWEYACHGYVNNPYFNKMGLSQQPCGVYFQDEKFEAWLDKSLQPCLKDRELIEEIVGDCRGVVKKYEEDVNRFISFSIADLDNEKCLDRLKELNGIFTELYYGYSFFTEENFDTSDERLLRVLPEVRIELSDFAGVVWNAYMKILDFIVENHDWVRGELDRCTSGEIENILKGESVGKEGLERRAFALVIMDGKVETFVGEDAFKIKRCLDENEKVEKINENNMVGKSACGGKSKGKVIRLGVSDYGKYDDILKGRKDYVLVIPMTRPEIVPYLKGCVGIVTDEGGITCHAAIISRELGKPCVIGTKFATQILKDGDLVEVDGDLGVVRVLEKNEEK